MSDQLAPGITAESILTGDLRNKVDGIWDAFWSGGISNPLEVLEQLTYLLFIRRLDELQTLEENKANRTGKQKITIRGTMVATTYVSPGVNSCSHSMSHQSSFISHQSSFIIHHSSLFILPSSFSILN